MKPPMSLGWPERGRKDRPVILRCAQDLAAHETTPFAAFRKARIVILSAAKDLAAHGTRPFAALKVTLLGSLT